MRKIITKALLSGQPGAVVLSNDEANLVEVLCLEMFTQLGCLTKETQQERNINNLYVKLKDR